MKTARINNKVNCDENENGGNTVVYLHWHFAFRPSTGVTVDKMQPFLYL